MSHNNTHNIHQQDANKPIVPFRSALVFTLFVVALFVAAVNFVNIMSHDTDAGHGGGDHGAATHHDAGATHENHDADHGAATHDNHDAAHHDAGAIHDAATTDNAHDEHADGHGDSH